MSLQEQLDQHIASDALEDAHTGVIRSFVAAHPNPFDRSHLEAHCTASAFVVSAGGDALLLVFHRSLGCWLQPGGHGEAGEYDGETVALREAFEESGLEGLELHPTAARPLDVDVHRIPESNGIPAHDHLDLRYLVVAPANGALNPCPEETQGARWFRWDELGALPLDRPMQRAIRKIRRLLGHELSPRIEALSGCDDADLSGGEEPEPSGDV